MYRMGEVEKAHGFSFLLLQDRAEEALQVVAHACGCVKLSVEITRRGDHGEPSVSALFRAHVLDEKKVPHDLVEVVAQRTPASAVLQQSAGIEQAVVSL